MYWWHLSVINVVHYLPSRARPTLSVLSCSTVCLYLYIVVLVAVSTPSAAQHAVARFFLILSFGTWAASLLSSIPKSTLLDN